MASDTSAPTLPSLVLHFDINKTIIICDPVKGVGCQEMINALLSEACWGRFEIADADIPTTAEDKLEKALSWKLDVGPTPEAQPGMVTYAELLEEVLKMEKKQLQALKNKFTESGQPGESIRATYEELQAKLQLPAGVKLPTAPASVGEGENFLVPSFLNLVLHLHKEQRDFRIVFRTFGIDIMDVIKEYNLFCNGGHPCFPDVPADMASRTIHLPAGTAEVFRNDAGFQLAMSSLYNGAELVHLHHGIPACAAALRTKLFDSPQTLSMAIRDCFPHWRKHKEADDSGKPLFVEPITAGIHHIFFDDNIERDRAHIVDARDVVSGDPLPFAQTKDLYLIKAEPMLAIQDTRYFINAVSAAEEKMAAVKAAAAVASGSTDAK